MLQLPGKHIAFVCSDPAGTNACVALAEQYRKKGMCTSIFSNKRHFSKEPPGFVFTETVPDFAGLKIDSVFTGTSHPQSSGYFEVNCIREARRNHIHTVSFIDHWVNFKLRFEGLQAGELPDEIWVVDEMAKLLAEKEGLPAEKLKLHANPYHIYLKENWTPRFEGKEYLKHLGIPPEGYHILFTPDPLSLRNGKDRVGFTEDTALRDVMESLPADNKVHLIVKSHPLQPAGLLSEVLRENKNIDAYLLSEAEGLELIHAVDLVIGFYSNMLLEAEVLGKPVLRYFPGKAESDLLQHKASLKKIETRTQLQTELKHCIYG